MSSTEDIEKRIKNVDIVIDSERNKKVFSNILQAFEKSKAKEFAPTGPNIWRIILKSPLPNIAAAAVIILAVSFFITHQEPSKQEQPNIVEVTKSPVEMMTSISLERAFRRGGIEAVENQCEQALKLLGTRTDGLSSQELLSEFNGS
ncbi:MAG: hypothetical protein H8D56_18255 [Planctomycetes bacterium]|nr:hypothetical protein [Planctomycetota bacterium]MBL7143796.1 hypothetical protein [Phycisphaerae bacterium]